MIVSRAGWESSSTFDGEEEQRLVGLLVRSAIAVAGGRVHLEVVEPVDGLIGIHAHSKACLPGDGKEKGGGEA
jgi:hypothetical protein